MDLAKTLKLKFPNVSFLKDIILQDDGNGPYIKEWNLQTPKPTDADLLAWKEELKSQYEVEQVIMNRRTEYPIPELLAVALWKHIIDNDSTELLALQAKREEVKAKYPKPEVQ